MKKIRPYFALLVFLPFISKGQGSDKAYVDSLKQVLKNAPNDSVQYASLHNIYSYYEERQKDTALDIAQHMFQLSSRNQQQLSRIINLCMMGYQQLGLGDYSSSLKNLLQAVEWSEEPTGKTKNTWSIESGTRGTIIPNGQEAKVVESQANHILGNLLFNTGNIQQAKIFFQKALKIAKETGYQFRVGMGSMNLGRCFLLENNIDSALYLLKVADSIAQVSAVSRYLANIKTYLGDIEQRKGDTEKAIQQYRSGIHYGIQYQNYNGLAQVYFAFSRFFLLNKMPDSSIFYSKKCLEVIQKVGKSFSLINVNKGNVYQNIFESYLLTHQKDSAEKYRVISLEQKDSINKVRIKTLIDFQQTLFENQLRLQKLEKDKIVSENRNKTNLFIAGIVLVAAITLLLYRNNRIKARDNAVLQKTLTELKSTQAQLVQSEKMASLGELTAGIAHEIQNPLNFVNNFSEVSKELIEEVKSERAKVKSERDEGLEKELLEDIAQNLDKIHHHGKRADAIVKGMLAHSRSSSGKKEPTDLNALVEECLRLSYHARLNDYVGQGLKAKDASFAASFRFEPDKNLPKVNIVPPDIGRVLLNLMNNAFYAVNQRSKMGEAGYYPEVKVSTLYEGEHVKITIEDNGTGIPEAIREKIFQPFFTTKPTGEGTGLGLSLSYDIVKAHGGNIMVDSQEGELTKISIRMPC